VVTVFTPASTGLKQSLARVCVPGDAELIKARLAGSIMRLSCRKIFSAFWAQQFIRRYPRGSSDTFMVFRHIGRAGFACAGQGKKPPDKTGGKNGRDAANRLEDQRQLCCGVGRRNSAAELPQSLNFFKFFGEREKRTRTKREQSQAKCALGCQTSCSEAISGNSLMRREQHSTTSCGHGGSLKNGRTYFSDKPEACGAG
jgi:hypothetical protein